MSDAALHRLWAMSAVHGQKCWACGRLSPLLATQIRPILPEGTDPAVFARYGLPAGFDPASAGNWALVCSACAGAPPADIRAWLDKAGRLAAMVRRAVLDAEFGEGMNLALGALRRRNPADLSRDDIAPLALGWASHQAKKTAHVRSGGATRDRLAEAETRFKPPPPLQIDAKVAIAFGLGQVSQLTDFTWALARAA